MFLLVEWMVVQHAFGGGSTCYWSWRFNMLLVVVVEHALDGGGLHNLLAWPYLRSYGNKFGNKDGMVCGLAVDNWMKMELQRERFLVLKRGLWLGRVFRKSNFLCRGVMPDFF
uniref:Uncharacterized protein n=1 Tax=Meloidogyne enterolobii TaxID=390850 RepID=A0A6V7WR08_MELEN|nr:unnamed protein product [Meloidogyne enterolobii]